jgi:hypothetical protein
LSLQPLLQAFKLLYLANSRCSHLLSPQPSQPVSGLLESLLMSSNVKFEFINFPLESLLHLSSDHALVVLLYVLNLEILIFNRIVLI